MLFATTTPPPPTKTTNHNNTMNRSSSFVNAFKFWPLQGQNNHNQSNTTNGGGGGGVAGGGGGSAIAALLPPHITSANKNATFGSSVAVQKLRESKWFKRDEQRIFCAVVECGFLVEIRSSNIQQPHRSNSYEQDEDEDEEDIEAQDENVTPVTSWFGIVLCKTAKDNKPKPETIEIFSVKIRDNGTFKMIKMSLEDIWSHGWELRINNFADKEKQAHNEKDIRNQVSFARKAKQSLWNNNKHFVYWCRYGHRQQDVRKRQMSECVKWNSIGMNAGMLLVMNKQKSFSNSK